MTSEPPVPTLSLAEVSHRQQDAANTLLENAASALDAGDVDGARVLVEQAKALGRDEHEGVESCSMAAHMALFTLVSDVAKDCDPRVWLEAAEAVLPTLTGIARAELLACLSLTGSESVDLEPEEARLLRRLVNGAERVISVFDGRVFEVDEVLDLLSAINVYDDAVAAIEGEA